MATSRELRKRAWNSLKGTYWNAFLVCIIAGIFSSFGMMFGNLSEGAAAVLKVIEAGEVPADFPMVAGIALLSGISLAAYFIQMLLVIFLDGPMKVGTSRFFLLNSEEKPSVKELFTGFKTEYMNSVKIMLFAAIKNTLWALLFIIPGIIKMLEYSVIPYILAENPGMSSKEVFAEAKRMMNGKKMKLFMLGVSFAGWILLCSLTCGIGSIFLSPYYAAAVAEFYKEVKNS